MMMRAKGALPSIPPPLRRRGRDPHRAAQHLQSHTLASLSIVAQCCGSVIACLILPWPWLSALGLLGWVDRSEQEIMLTQSRATIDREDLRQRYNCFLSSLLPP